MGIDSYNCQINQAKQTLPSAVTKQHHFRCLYTVRCTTSDRQTKLKTETKFWDDQSVTEEEEIVTLKRFIPVVFYLNAIRKNMLKQHIYIHTHTHIQDV